MKTVIITGATGAIGWATTQQLLAQDYRVIMAVRSVERAEKLIAALPSQQHQMVFVEKLNVSDIDSEEAFVQRIRNKYQPIYALVNNAETLQNKYHSKNGYELTYLTNFVGPANLTRMLLPVMEENGAIVSILSMSARWSNASKSNYESGERRFKPIRAYADSKMAMGLYMQQLSQHNPQLRINGVDPGIVNTPIFKMNRWFDPIVAILFRPFCRKPSKAAEIVVRAIKGDSTNKVYRYQSENDYPRGWQNEATAKRLYGRIH